MWIRALSISRQPSPLLNKTYFLSPSSFRKLCSTPSSPIYPCPRVKLPKPQPNLEYLTDPHNVDKIQENIHLRKSNADIQRVQELYKQIYLYDDIHEVRSEAGQAATQESLLEAAMAVPNITPDNVLQLGEENKVLYENSFINPEFKIRTFEEIARILTGARLSNLGLVSEERSYYLLGVLAQLEQALVQWTLDMLMFRGFSLISVPDILHPSVIQGCGMQVDGERTQVYRLGHHYGDVALSGTAEMAIGGFLAGKQIKEEELPIKLAAVSRCFRAETGGAKEEGGLYRVRQFTKVEMFVVTKGTTEDSDAALQSILELERTLFSSLGLSYRVLAMCANELGDPAYTKYDIEAWLPGRLGGFWGEISSCSNCTDYQARRLGITETEGNFVHTVNGTACAVPRMIIAICEQMQQESGAVTVPEVLQPYMGGITVLKPKPKKLRPKYFFIPGVKYFDK